MQTLAMKNTLLFLGALALAGSGFAQSANAPGQATAPGQAKKTDPAPVTPVAPATPGKGDPGPTVPDLASVRGNVDDAKNLAKGSNVVAAEKSLTAINLAPANTAAWHIETAQRLIQTAEQLAREGQTGSVPALTASALAHLDQADPLAKDAPTRATAKTLAGFIHERYRADPVAAKASYQAAVQLSPSTAGAAKEASDRLQKTDDNLTDKLAKGVK